MKKIVLLLAALVVFSSFVYADVGVGIWGRTVFVAAAGRNVAEGEESWIYQGWGPDWGGGTMMGIAVWWFNDTMSYHFKMVYHNKNSAVAFTEAWGDIKIMPDMITLQMGYREEQDPFRETTPVSAHDMNSSNVGRMNGWGVVVMVEPKDTNFKLGIQWRLPVGSTSNVNFPKVLDPADTAIQNNLNNVNIGASYTMPEMVKITVGSMIHCEAWEGDGILWPNTERSIFARIHLLMVPDLTCWLLVKYTGLEAYTTTYVIDTAGTELDVTRPWSGLDILLGAKYKMGDISIALGADFNMQMPKADNPIETTTTSIAVNIDPNYNLGNLNVGAVIGLETKMDDDDVDDAYGQYIYVEPYVGIPKFNMRIAFLYGMNADLNTDTDDFTWSIPVQVDFSFW